MNQFLTPTGYFDADHPLVRTTAETLTRRTTSVHARVAGDDDLWAGPPLDAVADLQCDAQRILN
jgi:hypothetical protein